MPTKKRPFKLTLLPSKFVTSKPKKPLPKRTKPTYEPRYDLYRDGLTQGSIATFLDCRHQFYLKYVLGLSGGNRANTTAFGSAFHDILSLTQHRTTVDGKELAPMPLDSAVRHHLKSLGTLAPAEHEEVTFMLAKIKRIIELYNSYYEKDQKKWRWIAREKAFNVPYESRTRISTVNVTPKFKEFGDECFDYVVPIRGRYDGIYCDRNDKANHNTLLETKTKGRIDELGIVSALPFDLQTQLYLFTAPKVIDKPVLRVNYDVIRTPQLRLNQGESKKQHLARMVADIEGRLPYYFMRFQVENRPGESDEWASTHLDKIIGQIVQWWESIKHDLRNPFKSPYHFINTRALFTVYGRCDLFNAITLGLDKIAPNDVIRRDHIYPELVD